MICVPTSLIPGRENRFTQIGGFNAHREPTGFFVTLPEVQVSASQFKPAPCSRLTGNCQAAIFLPGLNRGGAHFTFINFWAELKTGSYEFCRTGNEEESIPLVVSCGKTYKKRIRSAAPCCTEGKDHEAVKTLLHQGAVSFKPPANDWLLLVLQGARSGKWRTAGGVMRRKAFIVVPPLGSCGGIFLVAF